MSASKEEIANQIAEHIARSGSDFSDWRIGASNDAKKQLIEVHNVDMDNGQWIYRATSDLNQSRDIVNFFRSKGVIKVGAENIVDGVVVYLFKVTTNTRQ